MTSSSVVTAVGFMFAVRIIGQMFSKKFFTRKEAFAIVIFLSSLLLVTIFFPKNSYFVHVLISFLIVFAPFVVIFLKEIHFQHKFEKQIVQIFDQIILQMQMGRSFREALALAVESNKIAGSIFAEVASAVAYRTPLSPHLASKKLKRLYDELSDVENSSFRSIDRLKAYRYAYQVEDKFQRKSKQATLQTKIQAIFISIMYFGMMIFHFYSFSDKNLASGVVIGSLLFFFVGIFMIWNIGKRFKWKV
ncbi:MAG: hypothetical protein BroJett040_08490 [Oligoflexia bacterium]|nr:MAG: hypothetical protein BroJett040_08490 [Oligoflexia bacterium]